MVGYLVISGMELLIFLGVIGIHLRLGSCFLYLCSISVCFMGRCCFDPKYGAVIIYMLLFCELLGLIAVGSVQNQGGFCDAYVLYFDILVVKLVNVW